jgi:hypothetical protein
MSQRLLKLTNQEAVVKVWGVDTTTETIDISTLLHTNQFLDGSTQVVNIVGVTWTGQNLTEITVERGTDTIMTLPSTGSATIDFGGQGLPPEDTGNTEDIVVTINGGIGEVWIKLRKVSGYANGVENETFGAFDNPAAVGS